MYSQRLYAKITGSVVGIVLFSFLGAWLLITGMSYTLSFGCLVVILLITLFIIRLISDTNRRLSIFFGSLHSGDVTTHYPDEADDPLLRNLYGEMNRITRLFGNNRTEVEERRLYYESILRVLTHDSCLQADPIIKVPGQAVPLLRKA